MEMQVMTLDGGDGNDTLSGVDCDDSIKGGSGADHLDCGDGNSHRIVDYNEGKGDTRAVNCEYVEVKVFAEMKSALLSLLIFLLLLLYLKMIVPLFILSREFSKGFISIHIHRKSPLTNIDNVWWALV
jgi:hypothetical protein